MVCRTHKYANGGQVKCYADGGKVKKPKMKPPQKMADGGPVHGAPLSTPKPGGTTRRRPKPGDVSPDRSRLNPKKRTPSAPPKKKDPNARGSAFRDYRGVDGAVEDAVKGKK